MEGPIAEQMCALFQYTPLAPEGLLASMDFCKKWWQWIKIPFVSEKQLFKTIRLEPTIAAVKFTRRSSSEKSAFPKGKCTIPVLSALYSTFPCLNSAIAWKY